MNLPTVIVLSSVAAAVAIAVRITVRRSRRCRNGCDGCALRENCNKAEKDA